ncbi:acylphosphatase [Rhodobacterales bacterium HKCCE2091]|nr:acylphosphatase [Rhodobacterales bacterium HKCCE2091]
MEELVEPKAVAVIVTGRVQGVGYRAWVVRSAARLGLNGWVRNEHDGSVSALLDGPPEQVDALLEAMKSGPVAARVDRLTALPAAGAPVPGFTVRHPEN